MTEPTAKDFKNCVKLLKQTKKQAKILEACSILDENEYAGLYIGEGQALSSLVALFDSSKQGEDVLISVGKILARYFSTENDSVERFIAEGITKKTSPCANLKRFVTLMSNSNALVAERAVDCLISLSKVLSNDTDDLLSTITTAAAQCCDVELPQENRRLALELVLKLAQETELGLSTVVSLENGLSKIILSAMGGETPLPVERATIKVLNTLSVHQQVVSQVVGRTDTMSAISIAFLAELNRFLESEDDLPIIDQEADTEEVKQEKQSQIDYTRRVAFESMENAFLFWLWSLKKYENFTRQAAKTTQEEDEEQKEGGEDPPPREEGEAFSLTEDHLRGIIKLIENSVNPVLADHALKAFAHLTQAQVCQLVNVGVIPVLFKALPRSPTAEYALHFSLISAYLNAPPVVVDEIPQDSKKKGNKKESEESNLLRIDIGLLQEFLQAAPLFGCRFLVSLLDIDADWVRLLAVGDIFETLTSILHSLESEAVANVEVVGLMSKIASSLFPWYMKDDNTSTLTQQVNWDAFVDALRRHVPSDGCSSVRFSFRQPLLRPSWRFTSNDQGPSGQGRWAWTPREGHELTVFNAWKSENDDRDPAAAALEHFPDVPWADKVETKQDIRALFLEMLNSMLLLDQAKVDEHKDSAEDIEFVPVFSGLFLCNERRLGAYLVEVLKTTVEKQRQQIECDINEEKVKEECLLLLQRIAKVSEGRDALVHHNTATDATTEQEDPITETQEEQTEVNGEEPEAEKVPFMSHFTPEPSALVQSCHVLVNWLNVLLHCPHSTRRVILNTLKCLFVLCKSSNLDEDAKQTLLADLYSGTVVNLRMLPTIIQFSCFGVEEPDFAEDKEPEDPTDVINQVVGEIVSGVIESAISNHVLTQQQGGGKEEEEEVEAKTVEGEEVAGGEAIDEPTNGETIADVEETNLVEETIVDVEETNLVEEDVLDPDTRQNVAISEVAKTLSLYLLLRGKTREQYWTTYQEQAIDEEGNPVFEDVEENDEVKSVPVMDTKGNGDDPNCGPNLDDWSCLLNNVLGGQGVPALGVEEGLPIVGSIIQLPSQGPREELLKVALSCSCLPDTSDKGGRTPLMLSMVCRFVEGFKLLMEQAVDVDAVDTLGNNVLRYAYICNRYCPSDDLVKILLSKGADANISDLESGSYPLHWLSQKISFELIVQRKQRTLTSATSSPALLEDILNAGANINACDYQGRTPLHVAIIKGNNSLAQKLVTVGKANTNIVDALGNLPLHYAMLSADSLPLVDLLLRVGENKPIERGEFVDEGRGKSKCERQAFRVDRALCQGLDAILNPKEITEERQSCCYLLFLKNAKDYCALEVLISSSLDKASLPAGQSLVQDLLDNKFPMSTKTTPSKSRRRLKAAILGLVNELVGGLICDDLKSLNLLSLFLQTAEASGDALETFHLIVDLGGVELMRQVDEYGLYSLHYCLINPNTCREEFIAPLIQHLEAEEVTNSSLGVFSPGLLYAFRAASTLDLRQADLVSWLTCAPSSRSPCTDLLKSYPVLFSGTPSTVAATLGADYLLNILLEKDDACVLETELLSGRSVLHLACRNGHLNCVATLSEKVSSGTFTDLLFSAEDNEGNNAYFCAIMCENEDVAVKILGMFVNYLSADWLAMVNKNGENAVRFVEKRNMDGLCAEQVLYSVLDAAVNIVKCQEKEENLESERQQEEIKQPEDEMDEWGPLKIIKDPSLFRDYSTLAEYHVHRCYSKGITYLQWQEACRLLAQQEKQEQVMAATRIQAIHRGKKARTEMSLKKQSTGLKKKDKKRKGKKKK